MQLKSLEISKNESYMPRPDDYTGRLRYVNQAHGAVELALSDELSRKILAVIAEDLVAASKKIANELTADTMLSAGMRLENKDE